MSGRTPLPVPSPRSSTDGETDKTDGETDEIWVVEPNPEGHRLWYVRLLLEEQRRRAGGSSVVLVTVPAAPSSAEWGIHLGDAAPGAPGSAVGLRLRPWPKQGRSEWLVSVLGDAQRAGAYVVLPDADRDLPLLVGAALRTRLSRSCSALRGAALLMRGHPQPGPTGAGAFLAKSLISTALRLLAPQLSVRTLEVSRSTQHRWCRALGLPVTPDPVSFAPADLPRPDWLARHGLPVDAQVLLLAGELSERKYLPEVLRGFSRLVTAPAGGRDNVRLVLAGRLSAAARRCYDELPAEIRAKILLREGYLAEDELDTWVAMAAAVFVLHRNEGSSGILLKSAAARTPVIAGGARSVRAAARALGMAGRLVLPPMPDAIAAAALSLLDADAASRLRPAAESECDGSAAGDRPVDPVGSAAVFAASLLPPAGHPSADDEVVHYAVAGREDSR